MPGRGQPFVITESTYAVEIVEGCPASPCTQLQREEGGCSCCLFLCSGSHHAWTEDSMRGFCRGLWDMAGEPRLERACLAPTALQTSTGSPPLGVAPGRGLSRCIRWLSEKEFVLPSEGSWPCYLHRLTHYLCLGVLCVSSHSSPSETHVTAVCLSMYLAHCWTKSLSLSALCLYSRLPPDPCSSLSFFF